MSSEEQIQHLLALQNQARKAEKSPYRQNFNPSTDQLVYTPQMHKLYSCNNHYKFRPKFLQSGKPRLMLLPLPQPPQLMLLPPPQPPRLMLLPLLLLQLHLCFFFKCHLCSAEIACINNFAAYLRENFRHGHRVTIITLTEPTDANGLKVKSIVEEGNDSPIPNTTDKTTQNTNNYLMAAIYQNLTVIRTGKTVVKLCMTLWMLRMLYAWVKQSILVVYDV